MITEQERIEFKKRMRDMNNELKKQAKKQGIEVKSSIHDRWKFDDELYKKHNKNKQDNDEEIKVISTKSVKSKLNKK